MPEYTINKFEKSIPAPVNFQYRPSQGQTRTKRGIPSQGPSRSLNTNNTIEVISTCKFYTEHIMHTGTSTT